MANFNPAHIPVSIKVDCSGDYQRVCKGIIGDSKHTMVCDNYNRQFKGTMSQSDYADLIAFLTDNEPYGIIEITTPDGETVITYGYDDTYTWTTLNGREIEGTRRID